MSDNLENTLVEEFPPLPSQPNSDDMLDDNIKWSSDSKEIVDNDEVNFEPKESSMIQSNDYDSQFDDVFTKSEYSYNPELFKSLNYKNPILTKKKIK